MSVKFDQFETSRAFFDRLASLADRTRTSRGKIRLDFSGCGFFEANLAPTLQCIVEDCLIRGVEPSLDGFQSEVCRSLQQNGFLVHHGYEAVEDRYGTTLPFSRFELRQAKEFTRYLHENLKGRGMPMSDPLRGGLIQSISELFSNATAHSDSIPGVFVCGQYYPKAKHFDLTIADAGIGIPGRVRQHLRTPTVSSPEAIEWAFEEGHTTRTGKEPGGLGLKLLCRFIDQNGGRIQIASLDGFFEYHSGRRQLAQLAAAIPGTSINLRINTDDPATYFL